MSSMDGATQDYLDQIKSTRDIFHRAKLIDFLREQQIPLNKISEATSIKSSYLCHILRLKKLPQLIVDGYYSQQVSMSHLFIVSRLKNEEQMIEVYEQILSNNLTAAQTDDVVRGILYKVKMGGEYLEDNQKEELLLRAEEAGIELKVSQTRTRGRVSMELKGGLTETTKFLSGVIKHLNSYFEKKSGV